VKRLAEMHNLAHFPEEKKILWCSSPHKFACSKTQQIHCYEEADRKSRAQCMSQLNKTFHFVAGLARTSASNFN
jgi:hypothetical protein